jgi:hypothetical protein
VTGPKATAVEVTGRLRALLVGRLPILEDEESAGDGLVVGLEKADDVVAGEVHVRVSL